MNLLLNYILFFVKSFTISIFFIFTCSSIYKIKKRSKSIEKGIQIKVLNNHFSKFRKRIKTFRKKKLKNSFFKKIRNVFFFKKKKKENISIFPKPILYVIDFIGGKNTKEIENLRKEISSIILTAKKNDAVLLRLESPGGLVYVYGLAASQLYRLRKKKIHLTISIDKIAASGGYMMACVANRIISSPFAIVGSVGVFAQLPNFYKFLKKNNIDVEMHTAGKFKRTLSLFGKNTEEGRKKFKEELDVVHTLFKNFIKKMRPSIDIKEIATGEYWYSKLAIKKNLIDKIETSDEFLISNLDKYKILLLKYKKKKSLLNTFFTRFFSFILKKVL